MSATTLNVYHSPVENGDYLAVLNIAGEIPEPVVEQNNAPTCNIIILDVSGSMGQYVQKCCNTVLPALFERNGFQPDDEINLIRFECKSYHDVHKVKEFPTLPYRCQGSTAFCGVFPHLTSILKGLAPGTRVSVCTISDGDVNNPESSRNLASQLNQTIQNELSLQIDSTAIRLFTSNYANPDTTALSSVLQFNTTSSTPSLVDIVYGASDEEITNLMAPHYGCSKASAYVAIPGAITPTFVPGSPADATSPNALFKQHPWTQTSCKLPIRAKKTLFWISKAQYDAIQPAQLTISDVQTVDVVFNEDALTTDLYEEIIASRVDYYMMQIKLLRVVGTADSVVRLKQMSDYFIGVEKLLYEDAKGVAKIATGTETAKSLHDRLRELTKTVQKQNSRLGLQMAEIANMDATTKFNAAQAASFLRSTSGAGSASRGLVRRAGDDLDFDRIVRDEVNAMAKNLAELTAKITPEIESAFNQSFVSLATTMDGVRAVCELATTTLQGETLEVAEIGTRESLLTTLSATEILSFLNIVGVPVQATIGDYPDPYRYNINAIFTGHYCSLSDLMTLHAVNEDGPAPTLNVPGYKGDAGRIDNVVPLVENKDIFDFLHAHAPRVMSFYSSVGMRRMMVDIWETPHATLSAALIKMMRVVLVEPTEVNFDALKAIYTYLTIYDRWNPSKHVNIELANAIGHVGLDQKGQVVEGAETVDAVVVVDAAAAAFVDTAHALLPHIQTQLTGLAYPLINLHRNKKVTAEGTEVAADEKTIATILRATYYNEVWNAVRSLYRGKADGPQIIKANVNALIGFDPKWEPELAGLYEPDVEFDASVHLATANQPSFFQSTTWKSLVGRLSRLNVILAIPSFAELFQAYDWEIADAIDLAKMSFVKVLATPETPALLEKQQQLQALKAQLDAGADANYDYDDDEYDEAPEADSDEAKAAIKTKIAEFNEEQQGQRQEVNNNVEVLWAKVFFGLDVDGETVTSSQQHVNYMKMMAIISALIHTEASDRFPQDQYTPQTLSYTPSTVHAQQIYDIDYTADFAQSPLAAVLKKQAVQLYQRAYSAAVAAKTKKATAQVFVKYRQMLVETDNIATFIALLKDGITEHQYSAKFSGFQDPHFGLFWAVLVDKASQVPLRLDKLKIVILGQDSDKNEVWNQGRVLFDYPLKSAAVFFYDEDKREDWITLSKEHQERRAWAYRTTDLPNRHSHHASRPSYYGHGFTSLVTFRAEVGDEKYNAYCEIHKDCCGLTPIDQKRQRAGPKRHKKTDAAAATPE